MPSDVVQQIFSSLSMRDICNSARSTKGFWMMTCHLPSLRLELQNTANAIAKAESFQQFVSRRVSTGMKVN